MRLHLSLTVLILAVIFAKCEVKSEKGEAIVRSSVTKKADDQKPKVDAETKEQLEESENDDKTLEKQEQEAKGKDESDENATEESLEESDDGSGEEATVENADEGEKEDDKATEEDDATTKRAEESKGDKGRKKGKKFLAYPLFYPGDYFGHHHETGGPAGFHPGSIWEYPYPFVHPMYPSPFYPCACNCKDDKEKEKDKKEKDKKSRRKQLVPSHYYGPPSAGWGAYQPGHTGGGWGAPYWYKSYIPSTMQVKQAPKTESPQARHTIHDGLDFGMTHSRDAAHISYGADSGLGFGDEFGAGWHDGYTEHPVYGTYGGGAGRSAFVDPVYGDLENSEINGWGHGVGRPYLPNSGYGNGYGDGNAYGYGNGYGHGGIGHGHAGHHYTQVGHPYIPTHAGLNHHAVHNDDTFFGPHTAMLPTAQGHIQVASAGHAVGMGGHNLGGFADKSHNEHGYQGDFVGGIHADLGSHEVQGHHHDHAAAGHTTAPLLHTTSPLLHTDGLDGNIGDHFGEITSHHMGREYLGMPDHFGPIMEHGGHEGGGYGGGHHGGVHGGLHHAAHGHGLNHKTYHNFGAHAGHGGALDGQIGDSISAGHLFGGVHKSGVPVKQKHAKKSKGKSKKQQKKP